MSRRPLHLSCPTEASRVLAIATRNGLLFMLLLVIKLLLL